MPSSSAIHLLTPRGFSAGAAAAGIKSSGKLDVGLLVCDAPATAAAVFTRNLVVSPAVTIGRKHIAGGKLRGVVVNSGNANACTGTLGLQNAGTMCALAAKLCKSDAREFLPSSTGIIGHQLPMEKVRRGIESAAKNLGDSAAHAARFANAILTTDTKRKMAGKTIRIGGKALTIAGVCKGSGMIGPRLALMPPHATMLAYLTTDAKISAGVLRRALADAADASFNAVTVDDHPSTNDTAAILASGLGPVVTTKGDIHLFAAALKEVCQDLAYKIAADGEGATKVIRIDVRQAATLADAKAMARAVANSPLVKCAMNGNDPNWGRIVSMAGACGAKFDANRCALKLQNVKVFSTGMPVKFDAAAVSRKLRSKEVVIDLACGLGKFDATIWTCDLSKEYVTINADYHT